jgi:hypothetical protein
MRKVHLQGESGAVPFREIVLGTCPMHDFGRCRGFYTTCRLTERRKKKMNV